MLVSQINNLVSVSKAKYRYRHGIEHDCGEVYQDINCASIYRIEGIFHPSDKFENGQRKGVVPIITQLRHTV